MTEQVQIKLIVNGKEAVFDLQQFEKQLKKARTEAKVLKNEVKTSTPSFGNAQNGLKQLAYTMNDATMFAVDFRMGLMSISNNIPFVITGLTELNAVAKANSISFGTALKNALTGGTGVLLAINAVMTGMTLLLPILMKSKDETSKLADENERLAKSMNKLSIAEIEAKQNDLEIEKRFLELEEKRLLSDIDARHNEEGIIDFKYIKQRSAEIETELKKYDEFLKDRQEILNQIYSGTFEAKSVVQLTDAVNALENEYQRVTSDEQRNDIKVLLKDYQERLDKLSLKQKQTKDATDKLLNSEAALKKELLKISAALKDVNLSEFMRNELLERRSEILSELKKYEQRSQFDSYIDSTELTAREKYIQQQQKELELQQQMINNEQQLNSYRKDNFSQIEKHIAASQKQYDEQKKFSEMLKDSFDTAAESMSSAFASAIVQGKSFNQVLKQIIASLAEMAIKSAFMKILTTAYDAVSNVVTAGVSSGADVANQTYSDVVGDLWSSPVNKIAPSQSSSSRLTIQLAPVQFQQKGADLHATVNKQEKIKQFYR